MRNGNRSLAFLVLAMTALLVAPSLRAAELLNFKPVPISPGLPEFVWTATPNLAEGAGSVGNGDGELATTPTNLQSAPGLNVDTPFIINGIPGSTVNGVSGSTTFFDCTIDLTGFGANGPAILAAGNILQFVNLGSFVITSTDPVGAGVPSVLLTGNISGSTIVGPNGGNAGAFFTSTTVTYTGGLIFNAMIAAGGAASGGDVSISLNDVLPPFSIGGNGFMAPFNANATGLFRYVEDVPEPASIAMLSLVGLGFVRRRR